MQRPYPTKVSGVSNSRTPSVNCGVFVHDCSALPIVGIVLMGKQSGHILVVDDLRAHRRVVAFNLEKAGYRVSTAACAAEALKLAERDQFHLVITDHFMPNCTGADLVRKLRETDRYADTPMILLSAKTNELNLPHLYNSLSVLMVSKSCSISRLIGIVRSSLAAKGSHEYAV